MKPKYGEQISIGELYNRNKELQKDNTVDTSVNLNNEFLKASQKSARYGTPVNQPIGQMFAPYGGVKKIDEKLTEQDLYNIPEGRAQAQSGWKLAGNFIGQLATETILGMPEATGYVLDFEELTDADKQAQEGFDNEFSKYFREAKEQVQEEWFPIYRTQRSFSDNLWERLGDATWIASQGKTLGTTMSLMLPSLAVGYITGGAGLPALAPIAAAMFSRKAESAMEAVGTFESEYNQYLAEGKSDKEARELAGQTAAGIFKANAAMLPVDMMQYALGMKAFSGIKAAITIPGKTIAGKAANLGIQMGSETLEESYQSISAEEHIKAVRENIDPFGVGFSERLGDYVKDPDIQEAALLGALSGGIFEGGSKIANKAYEKYQNHAAGKAITQQFNDKSTFDKIDNQIEADLLTRSAKHDKFDTYINTATAYNEKVQSDENITPEEKQQVAEKTKKIIENANFVKQAKEDIQNINEDYKEAPNLSTQYALNKFHDKTISDEINKLSEQKREFYNNLSDRKDKAFIHTLEISALERQNENLKKDKKLDPEYKELLIKDNEAKIAKFKENLNDLNERIKEIEPSFNPDEYSVPFAVIGEFVQNAYLQAALENKKTMFRKEIAKAEKKTLKQLKEEEEAIQQSKEEEVVKDAKEKAETSDPVKTSKEANRSKNPKVKDAVDNTINKKSTTEFTPDETPDLDFVNFAKDRYTNAPNSFVKEKKELKEKLQSLSKELPDNTYLSDIIAAFDEADTPESLDVLINHAKNNEEVFSNIVDFFDVKNKSKVNVLPKEESALNTLKTSQETNVDNNPSDESTIEPEFLISSSESHNESNRGYQWSEGEFHVNLNYKFDKTKKGYNVVTEENNLFTLIGVNDAFLNSNDLKPGDTVTATYDPNLSFTLKRKEYTNKDRTKFKYIEEQVTNAELVAQGRWKEVSIILESQGEVLNVLFTYNTNQQDLLIPIKKQVVENGSQDFTIKNKFGGMLYLHQKADNTLSNINDYRKKMGVDSIQMGIIKIHKHIPYIDSPTLNKQLPLPFRGRPGQVVLLLENGAGSYIPYPLITRRLIEGENANALENTSLENNEVFKRVLDNIKSIKENEDNWEKVIEDVSLKVYYDENKKTKEKYYVINPANISEDTINMLQRAGITVLSKKEDSNMYKHYFKVDADTFDNIELQEYAEDTIENAVLSFLGNLKLQITVEDIQNTDKWEQISRRTKTNLDNKAVVNTSFTIMTDAIPEVKNTAPIKSEATTPKVEDTSDFENYDAEAAREVEETFERNNAEVDDIVDPTSDIGDIIVDEEITGEGQIKSGVSELFESNSELANAVYEALGYTQENNTEAKKARNIVSASFTGQGTTLEIEIKGENRDFLLTWNRNNANPTLWGNKKEDGSYTTTDVFPSKEDIQKLVDKYIPSKLLNLINEWTNASKLPAEKVLDAQAIIEAKINAEIAALEAQITPEQKQQAQQLYSKYLDTIFPDSKVKDIVYHGTKNKEKILEEGFKNNSELFEPDDDRAYESGELGYGYYFTTTKDMAKNYGEPISVLLNNPDITNETTFNLITNEKGIQHFVKTEEQIHILGSKQDIEGFKEFVGKETTETGVKTNLKPSSLFDIKSNEPQDSGTDVIDDSDADIDILFDSTSKYEPFKPIDLEKEKAWLNKNVPNLTKEDGTDLIASLQGMSRRVFAAFKDGIIYLSKDSREGSAYHEAFHSVFYTYLTPKEQRVIYREAAMLFGSRDKLTLQEALADTFREYVLDGDDTFVYPYKGIKKFFHTIRNFIVSNIFGQPTIEQLFNRINTGYYASKPVSEEIKDKLQGLLLTDARVREMTPSKQSSRENTLLATLSLVIDADLKKQTDYQHINRADFLTREMDAKNAEFFSNWIDYYMLKALKTLEKARDNYSETKGKEWTDEMNVFINNSLYYNKENKKIVYKGIGLGALHKLASREGIKLKLDQIIKSEEINLDSKGLIEEETKIDGWQIQVTQTSGKLGLSNEIRKQLSYIKTGKQDDLGFAEYMNFEEAYATMKVKLSDSYNVDTMMEKLEKYSKIDSSFGPLYNTLTAPGNETLKTKFFIDFAKSHSNYKRVFQTKDGKIVVSDSNGAFIRNVVLDEIRTSLYEQGYYNQEGEIIPEMADKAAHIKTAQEFNDFFKLNLPEEAIKEIPDTNVERIITNLKNNEDIFTGSLMKSLAKTVGYYRRDLLESSFMNVEGETVYSHIVPNFVAKQISKIKDAFAIDNLKKRNAAIQDLWDFYNTDPFYKNSPLFKTIFEMKDKDLVNNLEYALIDGMIWNAKNRGISYTDMSDKEFLATSINMWFNSDTKGYGWYQSPILSDAPTGLFIKLRKYSETDIIDKLYQVALQEYARIQDTSKSDVKFYDDNKNTFFFLDLQASDMKLSSTEIKQKIKDNLQKDYENFLQYATDSDLFNAEDNFGLDVRMLGDIPSFFDPFSKSYKKSYDVSAALGKDSHRKALSRHLREYYYNSVFATSQIITLTTGDPAYYKSVGDFYKRSKEIWSPAQVLDVNASFNYEGEPFTVGQTYSSVYVNDIEVVSNISQDFWNDYEKTGNIESAKLAAQYGYSNHTIKDKSGKNVNFVKVENATTTNFLEKNIFTVEPIQSVDKKAKSKAKIATQYIGFAEGIAGSSTALYAKQISEQSKNSVIEFQEEQSFGYIERTRKNASADATIDFGLNQKGESWTKKAVDNNKKKYIGINTNNLTITSEMVAEIVESLNSVNAKTLNIAGMGIYNMRNNTQEQVDEFVYNLLKQVIESPNLNTKIESIRTGGQTGFDEAGAKAAQKLGIKTIVLAPKGWIFRNKEGKDISNRQEFESRFNQSSIVNSGNYSSTDIIFVSVGGKRGNEVVRKQQQDRTIREAIKALDAGATIVTDNAAYVESNPYNEGEKRLAANLKAEGYNYSEIVVDGHLLGVWNKNTTYLFKTSKVNVADAQTFITPQRARTINIGLGRWNKEKHKVLDKIINNESLTTEDYNYTFDIYKPFYFGHSKIGNKVVPVQNKNSEYMLTPALVAKSPTLQKIYNVMQERNIDSISFESVVKVGLNNAVSWEDLQEGKFEEINIQKLNNSDFGIQQEVPEHYLDAKNLIGSQIRKHILANLNLEGNYVVGGKEIPAKEMIDLTHSIFETNLKEDYDKTIVDLGLDGAEIDYSKLVEILEREIVSRDLGLDLLEAVELNPITGKPNLHLSDPLHKDRNEKLVNSIFKNRITKQKIKGGPMVQVSSVGFMDSLQLVRNSDNTRLEYAECMLPWSSKKFFEPFMDDKGEINISDVPEELLKMVGYRIPTEDKYSMLPLKVVDFLPQHAGGAIMLPLEITTIAGSDFDVDKMYVMMPEFKVSGDKIEKIEYTSDKTNLNDRYVDYINQRTGQEQKDIYYQEIKKKSDASYAAYKGHITLKGKKYAEALKEGYESIFTFSDMLGTNYKEIPIDVKLYIKQFQGYDLKIIEKIELLRTFTKSKISQHAEYAKYLKEDSDKLTPKVLKEENLSLGFSILSNRIEEIYKELEEIEGDKNKYKTEIGEKIKDKFWKNFSFNRAVELSKLFNLPSLEEFSKLPTMEQNSKKARNNKLIDIMFGVLTNEHTYKQLITPGNFDNFKNNVNLIYLVSKGGKYETLVNKIPEELEKLVEEDAIKEGINLTSPLSQVKMFNRNMTGKKLVSIFANHNASHSILQHTNIEFTSPIVINGKEYSSLHNVLNDQNGYISRDLAEFLAAVVDNAKDPNAFKGNINTYTADVLATMIRVGVPMQEAIALLRQPIIVKLSQLYYKHGGNFAAEDAALEEMKQILGKEFEAQPVEFSNLVFGLNDNLLSDNQFKVLQGFLNIKEKSQSLVMLMQSMRSDTDGAGPNMADNEIIIRKQRKILLDENLKNVGDIFDGKIYKSFKAFNDYGVILPHNQAKRLFPLANTTKESLIDYGKTLFENSISKEAMNVKEINRYEMGLLTYIASNFDFFKDDKDAILDKVPATFNKYLKEGKLDGYMIKDYVKYVKDDKFKYGRLEFNNTGAVTPTLKADIKDSLFQMFFDESKDISRLALGLIKYNFHKEGYLFGPKSFNHLNPTRFFLELTDGVNIKDLWYKIFESQDLSLTRKQIEDFNLRYLKNNWKNSNFVPEVNITENNTVSIVKQGDLPIAFKVTSKSKQFTSGKNFIKLVKFKIKDAAGKTDFILFEAELLNEYSAVYKTTNKSGKFGQLVELNMHDSGLNSILAENNKYIYSLPKSVENNLKSNKPSSIIKLTPEQISKEEENRKACVTPSKTKKLR